LNESWDISWDIHCAVKYIGNHGFGISIISSRY
jgi:hypothetical protein